MSGASSKAVVGDSIVYLADDLLFPTNSGGRLEIRNEVTALSRAGFRVQLVVFCHSRERSSFREDDYGEICDSVWLVERSSLVRATSQYPLWPYQYSSRFDGFMRSRLEAEIEVAAANARAVICSHEWTVGVGEVLKRDLGLKVILRSHNDELRFMKSIARGERRPRRWLYSWLEYSRLKLKIDGVLRGCDWIGAISAVDAQAYSRRGFGAHVCAPVMDLGTSAEPGGAGAGLARASGRESKAPSAVFVGALDVSHTRAGLKWFVDNVWPEVHERLPAMVLVVAGRGAPTGFGKALGSGGSVRFLGEVEEVESLIADATVFVNPVFGGSGVNMKLAQPARLGTPIVTTQFGSRGVEPLLDGLVVADSASDFVRGVVRLVTDQCYVAGLW